MRFCLYSHKDEFASDTYINLYRQAWDKYHSQSVHDNDYDDDNDERHSGDNVESSNNVDTESVLPISSQHHPTPSHQEEEPSLLVVSRSALCRSPSLVAPTPVAHSLSRDSPLYVALSQNHFQTREHSTTLSHPSPNHTSTPLLHSSPNHATAAIPWSYPD